MSDEYMEGTRVRRTHQAELEHAEEHSASAPVPKCDHFSTALLNDPRPSRRGNAPVRQAAMHALQRTHGNRSVQRLRHGVGTTSPLPVQREEEELTRPRITPLPNPKLELPFGGGLFGSVDPIEANLGYRRGEGEYKLGYEYEEGNLVGQAKRGPWWAKAQYGKEGWGVGLGRGGPILKPPMPRMINDPTSGINKDPRTVGKGMEEISEVTKGPTGFGVEVGKDEKRGTYGQVVYKGTIGGRAKKRPKPKEHTSHEPSVPSTIDHNRLQKDIEEYKKKQGQEEAAKDQGFDPQLIPSVTELLRMF